MKKTTLITILFAALAVYGCSDDEEGGAAGSGGTAGSGGSAGSGGTAGSGGSAGSGGLAGDVVYEQDFNLLDINGTTVGDGWLFFVNVFDDGGVQKFGYNNPPQAAPNGTGFISGLVDDQGGLEQEPQQLNVFSDYNCCQPDEGHFGTDLVETNVFQEPFDFNNRIPASEVGKTYTFSFQAKAGNIGGGSTANAFIKTLDPDMGFAVSASDTEDMTNIPDTWGGFEVFLEITAELEGHLLQFGFQNNASGFEDSAVYYDNVRLVASAP